MFNLFSGKITTDLSITFLIVSLIFSVSCRPNTNEKIQQEKHNGLYELKDKFTFLDLAEFQTDTFNFDTRPGHYQEVDSNSFKLIFQENDRPFIGQGYDRDYFYSWQNRDTNFIEFTILTQDESSYCDILRYYLFDLKGKFISKFDIAAKCGDADWIFSGKGRQIDKYHFVFETIESDLKDGTMPEDELTEGDSIHYFIKIDLNGKVTRSETLNKHFVDERPK